MATLSNSIPGILKGKVGNVVFCTWKEVQYARSLPRKKKKKNASPAQIAARAKFNFLNSWLKRIPGFLRIGFKDYSGKMTGMQAAHSYNSKAGVVKGVYPDFEMDFSAISISYGDLPGAEMAEVKNVESSRLEFKWSTTFDRKKARFDDQVMLLAYFPENKAVFYTLAGNERHMGWGNLEMNNSALNRTAETYIAFISFDRKKISNSQYLGRVSLV